MKFILLATVFALFAFAQSCTHSVSRTSASESNSYVCGGHGSVEERIANCSRTSDAMKLPQDFVLVTKFPGKSEAVGLGKSYLISGTAIFKDTVTGLLWTNPQKFSGTLENAIDLCHNNNELKESFPDFAWRIPNDQDIKTVFNKRDSSEFYTMHDRILGSKRNNSTNMVKYYDYHSKGAQMMTLPFINGQEVYILCVADN